MSVRRADIPLFRIGKVPYGILPVTITPQWETKEESAQRQTLTQLENEVESQEKAKESNIKEMVQTIDQQILQQLQPSLPEPQLRIIREALINATPEKLEEIQRQPASVGLTEFHIRIIEAPLRRIIELKREGLTITKTLSEKNQKIAQVKASLDKAPSKLVRDFLIPLKNRWNGFRDDIPTVMKNGSDPPKTLFDILSTEATSSSYYLRGIRFTGIYSGATLLSLWN